MSLPSHQNPESRRRGSYVTACVSASIYVFVFLAANIFPDYDYQHGWPFVYMVRESGRASRFEFYGPWPFDDPPLVEISASALVLDVFAGIVLTFLAAGCVVYWQWACQKRIQFTLRGLFGFTSVAALLVATFMFFGRPDVLFYVLPRWCVCIVPCCLVLAAAHWTVRRSVDSPRKCRWGGIHWLSWAALVAVVGPFLHYSFLQHTGYVNSGREIPGWIMLEAYGWPAEYMAEYDHTEAQRLWAASEGFAVRYCDPLALMANILTSLAVVASTVFVVERWIRRTERRCRIRLKSILASILAVGILVLVLIIEDSFEPDWYSYPSWLFGVLSMIYTIELLLFRGVGLTFRRFKDELDHPH